MKATVAAKAVRVAINPGGDRQEQGSKCDLKRKSSGHGCCSPRRATRAMSCATMALDNCTSSHTTMSFKAAEQSIGAGQQTQRR